VATSTAVVSRGGGQTGSGTSIKVHVTDLSLSIKRNIWQMPFTVPGGLNYGDAVKAMVLNRLPSQTDFSIASTTVVLPEIVVYGLKQGGDPWQTFRIWRRRSGLSVSSIRAGCLRSARCRIRARASGVDVRRGRQSDCG